MLMSSLVTLILAPSFFFCFWYCDVFNGNPQQSYTGFSTARKMTIVYSAIWDQQRNSLGDWRLMSRNRLDLKVQPPRRIIRTRKFVLQVAVETKSNQRGDLKVSAETRSLRWEIVCKLFLRAFGAEERLLKSKLNCRKSPKSWRQSLSSALTAHPERGKQIPSSFWSVRATLLRWFLPSCHIQTKTNL